DPGQGSSPAARPRGKLVPSAPRDDEVVRAQAPADANAPAPAASAPTSSPGAAATPPAGDPPAGAPGGDAAAEPHGGVLSADRIPLGKQEVVVSVDVQSPANLNFEQPATVKIIVRNGGSADALGVVVRDELPPGLSYVSSQPEAQHVGD